MHPVVRLVHDLVRPLKARMNAMISRGSLDSANDASKLQGIEVTVGSFGLDAGGADMPDKLPGVEHFQPGGLTHVPLRDAEGIVLCIQGLRSHPVIICVSNRDDRPKGLAPGETALYTAGPGGGVRVHCAADGTVYVGTGEPDAPDPSIGAAANATKVHQFIAAMLAAGAGAGGPGAANFSAAAANWTAATSAPPGVGALFVKVK